MRISSTSFSRDVLLSVRDQTVLTQYLPNAATIQGLERCLPISFLRDFKFSALNSRNRKLFSNLPSVSPRIRQIILACHYRCSPFSRPATTPVFAGAVVPVDARRCNDLLPFPSRIPLPCYLGNGLLPFPRPIPLPCYFGNGLLPLPRPTYLPLYLSDYNCMSRSVTPPTTALRQIADDAT